MKRLIYILFLLTTTLKAQTNLVPNGSFEEYDDCPQGPIMQTYYQPGNNGVYSVKNWFAPTLGTSDYYNTCDTMYGSGVPFNYPGYQQPQDGNGYCGIVAYDFISNFADYREYIEVELNEPLIANEVYSWQFYVCLAEEATSAVNKIGMALSDTLVLDYNTNGFTAYEYINIPDIGHSMNIIEDSINWTKIEGIYTAHGGEKFLLIGVFYDSLDIDINSYSNVAFKGAYYYIDNVQLCKGECVTTLNIPNVFTPNGDGVNDVFFISTQNATNISIRVYNRWGNLVFYGEDNFKWDGTYNNKTCSAGVYFYTLVYTNKKTGFINHKQGTIHLLR